MIDVTVTLHEDLHFFLATPSRRRNIAASFHVSRSVKDLIESLGVPHVEVDCILVNGASVGFDYLLKEDDAVSVFPPNLPAGSIGCPEAELLRLCPPDRQEPAFLADVHLKTLARLLRMLGFDTLYDSGWDDNDLARISEGENRVLLSRDTRLLMRNSVTLGLYIRSTNPDKQVIEVIRRFHLTDRFCPFKRCISCNGEIAGIKREDLAGDCVPPDVRSRTDRFFRCEKCGKYYWNGSHVEHMSRRIEQIRRETG